jgi:hypothetical protein
VDALRGLYGVELGPPSHDATAEIRLPGCGTPPAGGRPSLDASAAGPGTPSGRTATIDLGDDDGVPPPFRGRSFPDAFIPDGVVPVEGDRVLARHDGRALWARSGLVERLAVSPTLAREETLRGAFRPGRFLAQLAVLSFVERLTSASLVRAPLPACIVIDDPNLHRPRYGSLDFAEIARVAREAPLHVAMATIPIDAWHADRRAVETFRGAPDALSLLVHGNNHVSRELARPLSDPDAVAQLAQALARISRFERRTGLRVSRTMAAPHGACARPTIRRLARLGFQSLTISRPRPWADDDADRASDSVEALSGARPIEMVDGLPLVLRTHVDRLDHLPFGAFLRQPLVVYGHQWDWPAGAEDLARTAEAVERISDVRWVGMDDVLPVGARVARNGSAAEVELYSRAGRIELPDDVDHASIDGSRLDAHDALFIDGTQVQPAVPFAVSPRGVMSFELIALDAPSPGSVGRASTSPWPLVRRLLTESRDRLPRRARTRRDR